MYKCFLGFLTIFIGAETLRAELRFAEPVRNLGEVRGGLSQAIRWEFRNNGTEPIEILAVDRSCGCLAPHLEQHAIPAGGEGTLVFDVRSFGQPDGPHAWFATVRYRQGSEERSVRLQINAVVRNEVVVQPTVLAFFGRGPFRQEVLVSDRRPTPLRVLDVRTTLEGVQARLENGAKVVIETTASLPPGRQEGTLIITTSDPVYSQFQVPITVQRSAPVSAAPDIARFEKGQSSLLVRLRSSEDKPLAIEKVETADPAITCVWSQESATLRIHVDPARLRARWFPDGVRVHLREPAMVISVPVEVESR